MKKFVFGLMTAAAIVSCKSEVKPAPDQPEAVETDTLKKDTVALLEGAGSRLLASNFSDQEPKYASFGKKISPEKALGPDAMLKKYEGLKKGDTVVIKFKSKVASVCKKKGCWMKMDLAKGKESFVRFKDYEFFVPLNSDNATAIVNGKAYIDIVSVEELKHYAKDGGKSQAEIDKITQPKTTYAFLADGVLMQE